MENPIYCGMVTEAVSGKYTLIERIMLALLRKHPTIKLRNITGERTAPCRKEVLMSALLTLCFGNYYSREPPDA